MIPVLFLQWLYAFSGGVLARRVTKRLYLKDHLELFEMGHVTDLPDILFARLLLLYWLLGSLRFTCALRRP